MSDQMPDALLRAVDELAAALTEIEAFEGRDAERLPRDPTIRLAVARLCSAARRTGVGAQHLVNVVRGICLGRESSELVALVIGTYFFPRSHAFHVDERLVALQPSEPEMRLQAPKAS